MCIRDSGTICRTGCSTRPAENSIIAFSSASISGPHSSSDLTRASLIKGRFSSWPECAVIVFTYNVGHEAALKTQHLWRSFGCYMASRMTFRESGDASSHIEAAASSRQRGGTTMLELHPEDRNEVSFLRWVSLYLRSRVYSLRRVFHHAAR